MSIRDYPGLITDRSARLPGDWEPATDAEIKRAAQFEPGAVTPGAVVVAKAKKKRGMNKTEAAYSERLQRRVQYGEIIWFGFECVRLRLADGAWFKPDFTVITAQGPIEFHEVKGFWREAARVRIKVAADRYRWAKFVAVQKEKSRDGGGWKWEEF